MLSALPNLLSVKANSKQIMGNRLVKFLKCLIINWFRKSTYKWKAITEAFLGSWQTSMMKVFAKIANGFYPLANFG